MSESPLNIDKLDLDELKALLMQALTRISAFEEELQTARNEIARLKGLNKKPKLKPSGMEKKAKPRSGKKDDGKGGVIFSTSKTGFTLLDRQLLRLHAQKEDMLRVLDHPEIPLHTNGSKNDIRCEVTTTNLSSGR